MNQQFLHIGYSAEMTRIPFILNPASGTDDGSDQFGPNLYVADGDFGSVSYEQSILPAGVFQTVHFRLKERVELTVQIEKEGIFLMVAQSGHFLTGNNGTSLELIAQTQAKLIFAENKMQLTISANPTNGKEFVLYTIEFPERQNFNPLTSEVINHIRRTYRANLQSGSVTSTPDFQKAIFNIYHALNTRKADLNLIQANINILLLEINQCYELQKSSNPFADHWDPDRHLVYSMAEKIILGLDEDSTIRNFASAQRLNPNKLKMLFKKHIGMPAVAFRISVRMQKARQLITETSLSIQEISTLVGYTNPAQFATMFKRKIGCSPNQLRKTSN